MSRHFAWVMPLLVFCGLTAAGTAYVYYRWRALQSREAVDLAPPIAAVREDQNPPVRLSPQAQKNLGLVVKSLELNTYWRKIELPGILTDRPGVSDRGVVAPVTGIVTQIHSHVGETVRPGAPLFVLRLTSESLHTAQRELFKASRELEILREQRERLQALAQEGALSRSRIIEIDNERQRIDVTFQAYQQDLQARGLSDVQIAAAAKGEFLTEITVYAPSEEAMGLPSIALVSATDKESQSLDPSFGFEFQELNVALGEQAIAGQVLCHLADHRSLLVEGRGFKDDMSLIQLAAKRGLPIDLDYDDRPGLPWPPPPSRLQIHHVDNSIDPQTRTFAFHLVLENQWQTYRSGDHMGILWRFRPGDRMRLLVAVEKFENVFVLPSIAVVREGPEAYVFRQNGELFDRRPVHILAEDRTSVVIASDGSLRPRSYVAQNGASSLQRVLKAQRASGQPANVHVHADGTVHAAH